MRKHYTTRRIEGPTAIGETEEFGCASFIRSYPEWPYDERHYYLSKLYQFLLVISEEKYGFYALPKANQVGMQVESLLNLIPRGLLPPSAEADWFQFWWHIWKASLTSTLEETLRLLEAGILGADERAPGEGS